MDRIVSAMRIQIAASDEHTMMKKLILLASALTLSASSNLAGADSTRHHLGQLPLLQPYEPSTPALLLIAIGLLLLRMRNSNNDTFVGQ